jgi:hypothetical protein
MVFTTEEQRGSDGTVVMPEEMREALARLVNTSSAGLTEKVLPNGAVSVDLQGRFQSATVATIGPDGKLTTTCQSGGVAHQHEQKCGHKAAGDE